MKTGPLLVVNLLLIAGAIYIYDATRPAPSQSSDRILVDTGLHADDLHDRPAPSAEAPMLGATEVDLEMVRSLQGEIDDLRGELSRIKRQATLAALKSGAASGGDGSGSTGDAPLPTMDLDIGNASEPVFNEDTLKSLEVYIDEVNRRKAVQRQMARIEGQMERLDLGLSEQENKAVVEATLAFQKATSDLYRSSWAKDEAGRQERKEAYTALHENYLTKINTLVPADAAEKIKTSRIARSRGFNLGGTSNRARKGKNR